MKAVVDTNVLVSGLINAQHAPGRVVDMVRTRMLQLVVDDRILAEYQSVLYGQRLRKWVAEDDARDLMAFLTVDSERIVSTELVAGLPDPGDAPFLEVAIAAGVTLVTGNLRHLPAALCRGQSVVTPADFIGAVSVGYREKQETGFSDSTTKRTKFTKDTKNGVDELLMPSSACQ